MLITLLLKNYGLISFEAIISVSVPAYDKCQLHCPAKKEKIHIKKKSPQNNSRQNVCLKKFLALH